MRIFRAFEWKVYRDLRLCALKDSPNAFATTWEHAQTHSDAHWQSRLVDIAPDTDLALVCEVDGAPGGLAWGRIEPDKLTDAYLYQMWVAPEYRGLGAGKLLLSSVIDWARRQRAERVLLGVTCGDSSARTLYVSAGFDPVGEPQPIRRGSALLAQEMMLTINSTLGS